MWQVAQRIFDQPLEHRNIWDIRYSRSCPISLFSQLRDADGGIINTNPGNFFPRYHFVLLLKADAECIHADFIKENRGTCIISSNGFVQKTARDGLLQA